MKTFSMEEKEFIAEACDQIRNSPSLGGVFSAAGWLGEKMYAGSLPLSGEADLIMELRTTYYGCEGVIDDGVRAADIIIKAGLISGGAVSRRKAETVKPENIDDKTDCEEIS